MTDDNIGDVDPEDAYDEADPIEDRISVLERVVEDLRARQDERSEARKAQVDEVVKQLQVQADEIAERVRRLADAIDQL